MEIHEIGRSSMNLFMENKKNHRISMERSMERFIESSIESFHRIFYENSMEYYYSMKFFHSIS